MNLQVRQLTIEYPGQSLFLDAEIDVADDELVAVKTALQDGGTSLLKGIAGLLNGVSGSVLLGEQDVLRNPSAELLHRIGYVYEAHGLVSLMSVRDNIALPLIYHAQQFHPQLQPADIDLRLERICDNLGIDQAIYQRQPHQINDVQSRLANLARALMVQPWLLLIDELEGGMSERLLSDTIARIRDFQQQYPVPIIVTAMSDTVLKRADRVYRIDNCKLVQERP
jgi:ABC-type branched-subunit amino acid transport system ATPase component